MMITSQNKGYDFVFQYPAKMSRMRDFQISMDLDEMIVYQFGAYNL